MPAQIPPPCLPEAASHDRLFVDLWRRLRRWRYYPYVLYEAIAWHSFHETQWRLMNYGWEPEEGAPLPDPDLRDHPERYALQLYHRVGSFIPLAGKDVVEVGAGRGGGALYLHTHFQTRDYLALDFSTQVVRFCNRQPTPSGLRFAVGDAAVLPCPDESRDIVVNVESSHNYPDRPAFFREAFRVLRQGGEFLYCDVLRRKQYNDAKRELRAAGFKLWGEQLLNDGVLRALRLDHARKEEWIQRRVPRFLHKLARLFAATQDSHSYDKLASGYSSYFLIRAHKPDTTPAPPIGPSPPAPADGTLESPSA